MNSKEAIENIKKTMIVGRHGNIDVGNKYNKEILTIERDLEILDILKKHYDVNSPILSMGSFISFYIYKDDKDFDKVKEWYENGKTN